MNNMDQDYYDEIEDMVIKSQKHHITLTIDIPIDLPDQEIFDACREYPNGEVKFINAVTENISKKSIQDSIIMAIKNSYKR